MNKKILLSIVTLFALICIIWNCTIPAGNSSDDNTGGGGNSSSSSSLSGPINPAEVDIVQLNRHLTNNLLYGKKILRSVIEAYPEILNFYGEAKKEYILKVLNASMTTSLGNGNLNNAFNYNNFNLLSNTFLYSKNGEGKYEQITTPVNQDGDIISGLNLNKKIFAYKPKMAESPLSIQADEEMVNTKNRLSVFINQLNLEQEALNDLDLYVFKKQSKDPIAAIAAVGTIFSVVNEGLNIIKNILSIFSPNQDNEIIDYLEKNFEKVFECFDQVFQQLDEIEQELKNIEDLIKNLWASSYKNALFEISSELDNSFNNISTPGLTESQRADYAFNFNERIDMLIQNFGYYATESYDFFINTYLPSLDNSNEMKQFIKPITLKFELPIDERIYYLAKTSGFDMSIELDYNPPSNDNIIKRSIKFTDGGNMVETKKLQLTYTFENPNKLLPISYEAIAYLHQVLLSRFQMNMFWASDVSNLNIINDSKANYLMTSSNHAIPRIRNLLNTSFNSSNQQLNNLITSIDNDLTKVTSYLDVLNKDWEFSVTKKPENHIVTIDDGDSTYTVGGNFDVFYHTPNSLRNFSGINFYTKEDSPQILGYYLKYNNNGGPYQNYYNTISANVQYPLDINNPYRYVMVTSSQFSIDNSTNYYLKFNVNPNTPYTSNANPGLSEIFPKYFYYQEQDDDGSTYYRLSMKNSPAKLPTKIVHEPKHAIIYLDGIEIARTSANIDNQIVNRMKDIATEVYRTKSSNLLGLFTELAAIDVDMNCYKSDPEISIY